MYEVFAIQPLAAVSYAISFVALMGIILTCSNLF